LQSEIRCSPSPLWERAQRRKFGYSSIVLVGAPMLTLYYSPGASSVIPHIALEEIGAPYERKLIDLAKGEHKGDAYLQINPRGKVPAVSVDGNVLTENVAILTYLAKQFPDARLLPQNLSEEARCISTMAWFASAVHPTFAHIIRPERFASETAAQLNVSETARKTFWAHCEEINGLLAGKEWMMGTQYTVCDPYALFFYDLGSRIKLPMRELAAFTAFSERMLQRPAVRRVQELEEGGLRGSNAWDGPYYPQVPRR
jgi:glutathione S-transferase